MVIGKVRPPDPKVTFLRLRLDFQKTLAVGKSDWKVSSTPTVTIGLDRIEAREALRSFMFDETLQEVPNSAVEPGSSDPSPQLSAPADGP
jgi:hypothetical protein